MGQVGNIGREMGVLLAEFVPGIENARSRVDEGAVRNDEQWKDSELTVVTHPDQRGSAQKGVKTGKGLVKGILKLYSVLHRLEIYALVPCLMRAPWLRDMGIQEVVVFIDRVHGPNLGTLNERLLRRRYCCVAKVAHVSRLPIVVPYSASPPHQYKNSPGMLYLLIPFVVLCCPFDFYSPSLLPEALIAPSTTPRLRLRIFENYEDHHVLYTVGFISGFGPSKPQTTSVK